MAKFHVTLHDGRQVEVEADSPQHADLAAGEYAQAHPAPKKTGVASDVGQSFIGGVGDFVSGLVQSGVKNSPVGFVRDMANAGSLIGSRLAGGKPQGVPDIAKLATSGLDKNIHRPETVPGEYARTVGQMLPAALAPGSALARIANVAVPALASETAGQVARKAGAGQNGEQLARLAGGLVGGGAASVRARPRAAPATLPPVVADAVPQLATNDAARAASYVQRVAKSSGVSPEQLLTADKGRTAAEALGRSGQTALGALARREGQTGDVLNAEVASRQMERPGRMLEAFAKETGISPEAAAGDIATVVKRGREAAAPLYEEAYAAGGVNTPQLDVLVNRPSIGRAMSRAARIAAEEGRDPAELGFRTVTRGDGSSTREAAVTAPKLVHGRYPVTGSKTVRDPQLADVAVQVENPTAQTWDYVKRGLDDVLETYRDKVTGKLHLDEEGKAILETLNNLRDELRTANPAYGRALDTSGDYLSASQSFREGDKFLFNPNITERQFADKLGKLTGANQEAFRGGIANKVFDMAQNGRLDPKVFKAPRVQTKLRMALGDEAANKVLSQISREAEMQGFERRYAPGANSITAEMRAAMGEQDEAGALRQAMSDFIDQAHRGPVAAAAGAASKGVARGIAAARTPGMSVPARDAAGQLLMMSPEELAAFLKAQPKPQSPLMLGGPIGGLIGSRRRASPSRP